jgi:hypothetical protein
LGGLAEPELGIADALAVADFGDHKLELAIAHLVTDPGAELPAPCAAGPLPVSVPVPVLLPALVPEPELPPSAAPMPARTKTKTTKPPMMPSVIFSPRCRFRGGCWWGAPGTDQDAPGGC